MTFPVPSSAFTLDLFPRFLGLVYFLAFVSLLCQVRGLYGAGGILPIRDYLERVNKRLGGAAYRQVPGLFWIGARDAALVAAAAVGGVVSLLLMAGILELPALVLLWALYLSFFTAGQEFLSYQWDALLLEAGFMTIFLPLAPTTHPLVAGAFHFFIFRFMLSAGVVKLTSGDPTWRNLTALCFHYETQPLPNRIAWYAHQLPVWVQKFSTAGTFFFELAVPFLFLGPPRCRLAGLLLLVMFQGLIIGTGNYGFFNVLTLILAIPLLDDRLLGGIGAEFPAAGPGAGYSAGELAVVAVYAMFILLNALQLLRLFWRPPWLGRLLGLCGQWSISNPYGLFAVMTTERYEFVIEGSADHGQWRPYEFRWKPGNPHAAPRQAAPHQPRLDWQMWFAALNPAFIEPWLANLLRRLLEGSPPVLALFREVPFREAPPALVRLVVYRYRFTSVALRRQTGRWWEREEIGMSQSLTLDSGALR